MIKIATIVSDIVRTSEFAVTGMQNDCLNYAQYARHIQPEVEKRAMKDVTPASIQIALSRLAKVIRKESAVVPKIELTNISTSSSLFEVTYPANNHVKRAVAKLQTDEQIIKSSFLSIGMGLNEVNISTNENLKEKVLSAFAPEKPLLFEDNLAALRLHVAEQTFYSPNVLYAFLKELSMQGINIVNLLSGYTEITFIVSEEDMRKLFLLMHDKFMFAADQEKSS